MGYDLIIRGGHVITASGQFHADIAVSQGRIAAIGQTLGDAIDVVDAGGLIITPGGVDPHCHIEQVSGMGLMNADTFETATRSAAMGGTTSVISFAAQAKGQRLSEAAADYAARAKRGAAIDHAFHLIIADATVPNLEADLRELIAAGHRSLKIFTTYNIGLGNAEILRVLHIAREAGALTCIHAENDAIIAAARDRLLSEGRTRPIDHAASRPRSAEIEAVARMCRLAEDARAPVMIFHVSTTEAAAEIRAARARGAPVWAETCPHYLFQTEDILDKPGIEGAKWMCSPPQRTTRDQDALWHALALGDLQLVSSDHAPYRFDETGKLSNGADAPFPAIANGMPGLELRQPLMFDAMVKKGRLGPEAFVALTATLPARLYGFARKGDIAPGMDADLVLWDPGREVTYGANDLHDNVGYNPCEGVTVRGWPVRTILRGRTIMQDGTYLGEPGTGAWIPRPAIGTRPADITGAHT
ncbi:dihydropyrimidinase [Roseibacterium beibuensis]|uniref:Dihydropyrimidinase n=1 Tax=[Roseibacterium] beibuensis TaxID=1193142 RepID=A0ABP9KZS8_9RHOB|nr:dihydropyrimidinase [Roseibacterium beibuensis]MCS6621938.1 dihydropyrimidinase [Roseibacterium beibuensis]